MKDNNTRIFIAFPVILVIIFILVANSIHFALDERLLRALKGKLSESEREALALTPSELMQKMRVSRVPIESFVSGSFPPEALEALVPETALEPEFTIKDGLSLIVVTEKSRMAIINGIVVKEGDSIDGVKVVKIEHRRVLLKNKTAHWLHMEERK